MPETCSTCAQPVTGRFCAECGTAVDSAARCRDCGNEQLPSGARFCNECGVPLVVTAREPIAQAAHGGEPLRGRSNLPWYVAGAAVVVLFAVILVPRFREEPAPEPPAAPFANGAAATSGAGPRGDARSVDLASMTPREQADRLFDRVMRDASSGDSAQARAFLPMALAAYDRVDPLDADARYHLGVLELLGGDPAAARAQADTILTADPTHLFGLYVAAGAEQARGNRAEAQNLYQRLLDSYATETARNLPEYQAHQPALPGMRAAAQQFVSAAS